MRLIHGDALEVLKGLKDNSVDAVVTDPPYGLRFMGHKWDYDVPSVDLWREVLRVLKPGGHLLSFFGTRTFHRGVVNIEDAGFEIRDMVLWLYGEGFPKSYNIAKGIEALLTKKDARWNVFRDLEGAVRVSDEGLGYTRIQHEQGYRPREYNTAGKVVVKEYKTVEARKWIGWGTALKPACEPIVLARKPLSEQNVAQNVLRWGVGGLNIDACRIAINGEKVIIHSAPAGKFQPDLPRKSHKDYHENTQGRFPANVILDPTSAEMLDAQSGITKSTKVRGIGGYGVGLGIYGDGLVSYERGYDDKGGASRFFYVAKAKKEERYAYCKTCGVVFVQKEYKEHKGHEVVFHPTVKPVRLMRYLVRLVTPPNGVVLDPFMGTGTTGVACALEGFDFIGVEVDEVYYTIAKERLGPYMAQRRLTEVLGDV